MHVVCMHVEVKETNLRSRFSSSTFTWVLGIELKSSSLFGKCPSLPTEPFHQPLLEHLGNPELTPKLDGF